MKRVMALMFVGLVLLSTPANAGMNWSEWKKEYSKANPFISPNVNLESPAITVWIQERQEYLAKAWKANQKMVDKCGEAYIKSLKECEPKPVAPAISYIDFGGEYTGGSVNWDAIAACESGGNWAANTGNGYWGGLQFHPGTWYSNGGGQFSGEGPFPYSRGYQIGVAESVLRSQGIGAWPHCGRYA